MWHFVLVDIESRRIVLLGVTFHIRLLRTFRHLHVALLRLLFHPVALFRFVFVKIIYVDGLDCLTLRVNRLYLAANLIITVHFSQVLHAITIILSLKSASYFLLFTFKEIRSYILDIKPLVTYTVIPLNRACLMQ